LLPHQKPQTDQDGQGRGYSRYLAKTSAASSQAQRLVKQALAEIRSDSFIEDIGKQTIVVPGVILGIESWLSADQHLEILERVGSKAVQVYYDVCNSNERGYDIYMEIRKLGKRICEIHAKENGSLLSQGKVDFQKVRAALDDIGYRGWVQIEGAVPPGKSMLESYQANWKFLRGVLS
jgi:sugar phosphate isomerase/epimerase